MVFLLSVILLVGVQPDLPTVVITHDNTIIDRSCRLVFPRDRVIPDSDGNGVIQVAADGITIEVDQDLRDLVGGEAGTAWEELEGVGLRINGRRNVTVRGLHLHLFKVGIWATDADGLVVEDCDVSGGFAQRLGSTPAVEDSRDWLRPHDNDEQQWRTRYGAGICIENSADVTVRGCSARRRQNGLILDRVTGARVYDNDFSFLSGWGIAMWRTSDSTISRNALDFCVRGYSHGVYNRGQDSAGLLMFEQCNRNVIVQNSITHGGDGLFAFGGNATLAGGERTGDNANVIIDNDLSYAAAHGLELTFSFNNGILRNRLVGNAICGIWGGYSQETLIAMNRFIANGDAGYGLERGGVCIEHGAGNVIRNNTFRDNATGVQLWDDDDAELLKTPWAKANHRGSVDNVIRENQFTGGRIGIQLRNTAGPTMLADNTWVGVEQEISTENARYESSPGMPTSFAMPEYEVLGRLHPVGARENLGGRQSIVMGPWFPWDHRSPMGRIAERTGRSVVYEMRSVGPKDLDITGDDLEVSIPDGATPGDPWRLGFTAPKAGVYPYRIRIRAARAIPDLTGTIVSAIWRVTVFPWTVDPRKDLDGWRREASGPDAMTARTDSLDLVYANGGPRDMGLSERISDAGPGPDRFGTIARTTIPLPAGRWRVRTRSDDGVRVTADGAIVLENWTWHGPTTDVGEFDVAEGHAVQIVVEHFEIDGYAVLEFDLEPAR